jgi:hypothetical protein
MRKVSHPRAKFKGKAQTARLARERWRSTDSGLGVAFIEEGA